MSGERLASKPPGSTIYLLAMIAALGSLATQLIVPALPELAHDLHSNAADVQIVIGGYLGGLGAGQLLAGPVADRIGRRPVLLAGLALYCLASVGAALAPVLPLLLGARLLQALGGAAGVVTARVLVSDIYGPKEAVAKQATLMAVVLISPALAPVIGGLASETAGWRSLFAGLAVAGLAGAVIAARALPETRTAAGAGPSPGLGAGFAKLVGNPDFLRPAVGMLASTSALYMYLGTTPFLLAREHGLSAHAIGLCLMLTASTSIAGTFLVGRIEQRGDAMKVGVYLNLAVALALLLFSLTGSNSLAGFLAITSALGIGAGISGPAGISRVIASQRGLEGTAASLAGAGQMLFAGLAMLLLGRLAPVSLRELAMALVAATGIAALAVSRRPRPM